MNNINILDTGDNYIIAPTFSTYEAMLQLYHEMDITINIIPTQLKGFDGKMGFIYETIGHIVPYEIPSFNVPDKLIDDIAKCIDFHKVYIDIKKFWAFKDIKSEDELANNEKYGKLNYPATETLDDHYAHIEYSTKYYDVKPQIIFNAMYNLAIVKLKNNDAFLDKMCIHYPEFTNVKISGECIPDDLINAFLQVFHKKSFKNVQEITDKFKTFKTLYNINDDVDTTNEKYAAKKCLDTLYIQSSSFEKRIKANDVYKDVINRMCIPFDDATAFKKRLAGYLAEFSVQKKRFSDAYYYYGLEKKQDAILLSDLLVKRAKDLHSTLEKKDTLTNHALENPLVAPHNPLKKSKDSFNEPSNDMPPHTDPSV